MRTALTGGPRSHSRLFHSHSIPVLISSASGAYLPNFADAISPSVSWFRRAGCPSCSSQALLGQRRLSRTWPCLQLHRPLQGPITCLWGPAIMADLGSWASCSSSHHSALPLVFCPPSQALLGSPKREWISGTRSPSFGHSTSWGPMARWSLRSPPHLSQSAF